MKLKNLYKKKTLVDYIIYASVLVGGILFDQLTKWLTVKNMALHEHIPVIKTGEIVWASFLHIRNDGAAFGMMDNAPWVFNTVSTVAILGMTAFLFLGHMESKLSGIGLSMMISGGIGNMIDRTALGYVVDMIHLDIFNETSLFASVNTVFNVADTFVCIGAGVLVVGLVLEMIAETKQEKAKKSAHTEDGAQ